MANLNNYGHIEGRLTKNPVYFTNRDGSKKVMLTVAAKRNYKNKATGQVDSDFIEVEGFVSAGVPGLGIYDYLSARDRVGIGYSVQSSRYQDKTTGQMVYKQVLRIQDVALRETKAEAAAHRQQALGTVATPAVAAPAAIPAEQMQLPIVGAADIDFADEDDILAL